MKEVFQAVLVGTAVGDSLGLPAEGLSARKIARRWRGVWRQRLVFGRGMVSDDTEHTVFVAQCLAAKLRSLVREYDELRKRRFTIVKLDRPIQRGWRRSHVLTENAQNRPDRSVLESILEVIGTVSVHHSRNFQRRRRRHGRRVLVDIEQPLRSIRAYEWSRRNPPAAWYRYFRYELVLEWNRHWQPHWVFAQPSLFELKVERNWLWYFRELDSAVESRLSEIEHWLETHNGWARYGWLKGHYRWSAPSNRRKFLDRAHRREIDRAIAIFPEVDPASLAQRTRISRWRFSFIFPA